MVQPDNGSNMNPNTFPNHGAVNMRSVEEEAEVQKSHIIRIPCMGGINIVEKKDVIVVRD